MFLQKARQPFNNDRMVVGQQYSYGVHGLLPSKPADAAGPRTTFVVPINPKYNILYRQGRNIWLGSMMFGGYRRDHPMSASDAPSLSGVVDTGMATIWAGFEPGQSDIDRRSSAHPG